MAGTSKHARTWRGLAQQRLEHRQRKVDLRKSRTPIKAPPGKLPSDMTLRVLLLGQFTPTEIAEQYGVPTAAVRRRIRNIKLAVDQDRRFQRAAASLRPSLPKLLG